MRAADFLLKIDPAPWRASCALASDTFFSNEKDLCEQLFGQIELNSNSGEKGFSESDAGMLNIFFTSKAWPLAEDFIIAASEPVAS